MTKSIPQKSGSELSNDRGFAFESSTHISSCPFFVNETSLKSQTLSVKTEFHPI